MSLRLVSANGGAVEVLAKSERGSDYWDPCFLPDGRTLLFSARLPSTPGIHRLDLETRAGSALEGAEHFLYPKCGPQGQVLASSRVSVSQHNYMVYWPQHALWEDLGPLPLVFPTWTRDGQSFCGLDIGGNRIECYSFASRRLEARAEIGDMPLTWASVPWMGLDADDSPMVMRDRSTRDIYSLDWEAQ